MKTRFLTRCLLTLLLSLAACGEVPTATPLPGQSTLSPPTVDPYPMSQVTWTPDPYPRVIPTDVPWTPVHPSPPPAVPILGAEWAPLEERETYVSTTVVVAPVGDGPGEIGYLVDARYGLPVRASHFALDGQGNLYILDMANRRVAQFDANGDFVANIVYGDAVRELKAAADLAVDPEGRVYIYDTGASVGTNLEDMAPKVRLFDRQGTMLRTYPVPSWFSGQIHAMRVDEQGILWVEGRGSYPNASVIEGESYPVVAAPLGNVGEVFDEEYQKAMAISGHMLPSGKVYLARAWTSTRPSYLYNEQGQPIYAILRRGDGLAGIDQLDNIYLETNNTGGYTIRKYNPQAKVVASFDVPLASRLIDSIGTAYCLVLDRQTAASYRIIRWQRQ
jgi:hypothetical protein